jgi:glycosyltransferase involved in cell wall biosynthesis
MQSAPYISVVLPVFNGEKYLRQSIDSVLAQDDREFELIIWDDCSTDGSKQIVDGYQDPRIRRFENATNLGLFKTLNLAIGEARGEWIRLWSQDDMMKPICLGAEREFVNAQPEIGMLYCAVDIVDENGKVTFPTPFDPTPQVVPPSLATQIMFFHGSISGNIANVGLKRSVLDEVGLFCEDMKISGDFEMWMRVAGKYSIGHISEALIFLRSHSGQFSRARGSYAVSIKEDQLIYRELEKRLPAEIRGYSDSYHRWHRGPMYWHHLMRCVLSRDLSNATSAYQTIRRLGVHPIFLAAYWLFTANQKLYRMKPRYAGDFVDYSDE